MNRKKLVFRESNFIFNGYQRLYQVFIFKNAAALAQFRLGDKAGGDVSASATAGLITAAASRAVTTDFHIEASPSRQHSANIR